MHEARAAQRRRGGPPHRVPLAWSVAVQVELPEPDDAPDPDAIRFDHEGFGAELAAQMAARKVTAYGVAESTGVRVDAIRRAARGIAPSVSDVLALAHWLREPNVMRWSIAVAREPADAPAEPPAAGLTGSAGTRGHPVDGVA